MTKKGIEKELRIEDRESGQEMLLVLPVDYLTFTPRERQAWISRKRVDPKTADAIRRAFAEPGDRQKGEQK